jgi:hypothetical protein
MKFSEMWRPAFALTILGAATPAMGHHSFAMFDQNKEKTVTGVVEKFAWTNPHVMLDLKVQDKQGKSMHYRIESASVNLLMRQGWKVGAVKHGDRITAVFNPLKDGRPGGLLVRLVRADGSELKG